MDAGGGGGGGGGCGAGGGGGGGVRLPFERVLVTGAAGYLGSNLVRALLRGLPSSSGSGFVRALDRRPSPSDLADQHKALQYLQGDLIDRAFVQEACKDVQVVFHVASVISTVAPFEELKPSNINATALLLEACQQAGVKAFVYTSSTAVIFQGHPIHKGDETIPYPDPTKYVDGYSLSKQKAEELVLVSNGKYGMATCALRAAGFYGPNELVHTARVLRLAKLGLLLFACGNGNSLTDWVYIDDLVEGHVLAAVAIADSSRREHVAGQAYFISSHEAIDCGDFFKPIVEQLGYAFPTVRMPFRPLIVFATIMEFLWFVLRPVGIDMQKMPLFLSRSEVVKLCTPHFFSSAKASRDFGYKPGKIKAADGLQLTIPSYIKTYGTPLVCGDKFIVPFLWWWLLIGAGLFQLYLCAFQPALMQQYTPFLGAYGALLEWFMSRPMLLYVIWYAAWLAHVVEGGLALRESRSLNHSWRVSIHWFGQTFLLGFPSFQLLLAVKRRDLKLHKTV